MSAIESNLSAAHAEDCRAQHIAELSRIAVTKFTGLKRAVDLTRAGGALLVVAALIAVGGGLA
ncbi:hypothetical protein [Streptomyces alfalfae]|uniref:hypothetical protein n=1 Tax=Streptomyces alfalfae TaxID=1642299 RepID=UPI003CC8296F